MTIVAYTCSPLGTRPTLGGATRSALRATLLLFVWRMAPRPRGRCMKASPAKGKKEQSKTKGEARAKAKRSSHARIRQRPAAAHSDWADWATKKADDERSQNFDDLDTIKS